MADHTWTNTPSDRVREALEHLRLAAEGLRGWERLDGTEAMDEEYHASVAKLDAEAIATLTAALDSRRDGLGEDYGTLVKALDAATSRLSRFKEIAQAVKAIPKCRDDSPELNTVRNNATSALRTTQPPTDAPESEA